MKLMKSFRETLPAFKVKGEFLKAVAENQVRIVVQDQSCNLMILTNKDFFGDEYVREYVILALTVPVEDF